MSGGPEPSNEARTPEAPTRWEPLAALDRRYQALRMPPAPARRAALSASLERHGQQQPVLVSDGVEAARLVVLDGFKRVELLEARGADQVWVVVASLDGPSSLAALAAVNAARSGLSDLEESWIVASLTRDHGLRQADIAALLGRHRSWVCRRLSLHTRLEKAVQEDVQLGLLPTSAAREIARLPRGNQAAAAKTVSAHGLSCQQVVRLVDALREADPETRRAVLRDPLSHLPASTRSRTTPRPDARLSRLGNGVREQLLRIHAAAGRLDEVVLQHAEAGLDAREKALLGPLVPTIIAKTRAALHRVEGLVGATAELSRAS